MSKYPALQMFYQPVVMVDTFSLIFPSGALLHSSTIERLTSIHGAPFRKKLITFLRTKYFFDAASFCFCRHEILFCAASNFFLLTWNTFACNINTFLSTTNYFLCRVKLFVSTQNYFSCNTNFREFNIFWRKIKIISISMWTLAPP